jgi:NTP pyrophosphatase (non-canonical NTP hydrolase)
MTTLNEYQDLATRTAIYPGRQELDGLLYTALGLAGEAGEFANEVKKILRDDKGHLTSKRREELKDELGDVLWYVAQCAFELQVRMEVIGSNNIDKLKERHAGEAV